MECLRIGDIILRNLNMCASLHYGIIYSLDPIIIVDFNLNGYIKKLSLHDFMEGETMFWIEKHTKTPIRHLRPVVEMMDMINNDLGEKRHYDLFDYNCEKYAKSIKFKTNHVPIDDQIFRVSQEPLMQILRIVGQKIKSPKDTIAFRYRDDKVEMVR